MFILYMFILYMYSVFPQILLIVYIMLEFQPQLCLFRFPET